MNTIFIYLLSPAGGVFESLQGLVYFYGNPHNNLVDLTYDNLFCHNAEAQPNAPHPELHYLTNICHGGLFDGAADRWAQLTWTIVRIAFWVCVAGWLHRIKWYWAL